MLKWSTCDDTKPNLYCPLHVNLGYWDDFMKIIKEKRLQSVILLLLQTPNAHCNGKIWYKISVNILPMELGI